jgi:hypothetical protein
LDLIDVNLDTILHLDFSDVKSQDYKGASELKEFLTDGGSAEEIYMHLEPNDVDALLIFSNKNHIVNFRLKKTHEGTFEVVELLAEPLPPKKQ